MKFRIKRKYKIRSRVLHLLTYFYYRFLCRVKLNKLVSVIIACKNAENTILETLKSIENQSYTNIEIIIIDDGSNDNSVSIIEDYIESSNKEIIFKKLNNSKGSANARNMGMNLAKGFYICFNDADDVSNKYRIEFQVKALRNNSKKVFSECLYFRKNLENHVKVNGEKFMLCVISMLFEREKVLNDLGGMIDVRPGEDSELRERILAFYGDTSEKIIYLPLYQASFSPDSSLFSSIKKLKYSAKEITYEKSTESSKELNYYREEWHKKIRYEEASPHINFKP